jgi:hypothetical protein
VGIFFLFYLFVYNECQKDSFVFKIIQTMTSRNKTLSNECLSSSGLEIIIDDQSASDSIDEDSNSQTGHD